MFTGVNLYFIASGKYLEMMFLSILSKINLIHTQKVTEENLYVKLIGPSIS